MACGEQCRDLSSGAHTLHDRHGCTLQPSVQAPLRHPDGEGGGHKAQVALRQERPGSTSYLLYFLPARLPTWPSYLVFDLPSTLSRPGPFAARSSKPPTAAHSWKKWNWRWSRLKDLDESPASKPRSGKLRSGQVRSGQARPGQARSGQARPGQARPGEER